MFFTTQVCYFRDVYKKFQVLTVTCFIQLEKVFFLQSYYKNQNKEELATNRINENIYLENPNQSAREKSFKSTTDSIYNSVGKKVLSTVLDETSKAQSSSLNQNSNLSSYKGTYDTKQKQSSSSCRL